MCSGLAFLEEAIKYSEDHWWVNLSDQKRKNN